MSNKPILSDSEFNVNRAALKTLIDAALYARDQLGVAILDQDVDALPGCRMALNNAALNLTNFCIAHRDQLTLTALTPAEPARPAAQPGKRLSAAQKRALEVLPNRETLYVTNRGSKTTVSAATAKSLVQRGFAAWCGVVYEHDAIRITDAGKRALDAEAK